MSWQDRARQYHDQIVQILLDDWDPIGVCGVPEAADEYDDYVGPIHRRLIQHTTERKLFKYLWEVETVQMGLRGNRSHTEAIANQLIRLRDRIESGVE